MAQGRETPSGYDWEDRSVPTEPEPLALPNHHQGSTGERPAREAAPESAPTPSAPEDDGDPGPFGAPSFTYAPQATSAATTRRRGVLPAWAIVAIVVVQAAALVASVALVLGGIERMSAGDPASPVADPASDPQTRSAPPASSSPEREPGTVTDTDGREVTDGTGGYDDPARIGEHTVSWPAWTSGTIAVTALEVDVAATVPGASGKDVVQDGYRLILATYEVRYDGPGQLAPAEELWMTGETDLSYFPDIAQGLVADPMKHVAPLEDGGTARFHSAFLVPEEQVAGFRLGVETFSGEILYFATT